MSRIGRRPVEIPAGVKIRAGDDRIEVEGPKGKLEIPAHPGIRIAVDEGARKLRVEREGNSKSLRARHGLVRALVRNMVQGVTDGFERKLEIMGVGYGAKVQGSELVLTVGFATPVRMRIPEGIVVESAQPTAVRIRGMDRQRVGEFAAQVRRVRPPEPYKGKGIRYEGEVVRRKAGKAFVGAGG